MRLHATGRTRRAWRARVWLVLDEAEDVLTQLSAVMCGPWSADSRGAYVSREAKGVSWSSHDRHVGAAGGKAGTGERCAHIRRRGQISDVAKEFL